MTEAVIYEMVGAVAVITINRPESRNAINSAVRQGLIDAWRHFETDPAALVAILDSEEFREGRVHTGLAAQIVARPAAIPT